MPFCSNCGDQITNGMKFCSNCGTSATSADTEKQCQRKVVYDGEIHKCPSCGETLNLFAVTCSVCGYELRGAKTSSAMSEFAMNLVKAQTEGEKAAIIRSFPVPNTKEDIFEFMILASTNIAGEVQKTVFNAWLAKFEQSYQKALLVFKDDTDFEKIQVIYDKTSKQIVKGKVLHTAKTVGGVISKFMAIMPNPIFGIVTVILVIYEIVRIFSGNFAGIDIIFVALILRATYRITQRKVKSGQTAEQKANQEATLIRFPHENGENAYVFQAKLEQKGFTNIKMINLRDIKVGLLKKSGEIESVLVNGKSSRPIKKLDANASIIITYHGRPEER